MYHGVHWTRVEKSKATYGEVDFIVLAPNGRVLLIEQKSGFLSETDEPSGFRTPTTRLRSYWC